ncbi:MAG TPA: hypothetical protein VJK07_03560 [Candidatus Nanoarchaeia archaeon]|nr:hypothetical protein [Candidatus Nanoarchaeia archaeon]
MKKPVLSKTAGWLVLAVLVLIDSLLTKIRGEEGNPLWKPIVEVIGTDNVFILVIPVLLILFIGVKAISLLVKKIDKTPMAEELILTTMVIIFAFYDLWVISVDFFSFRMITDFRKLIIPLIAIGLIYSLWAESKLKKILHSK